MKHHVVNLALFVLLLMLQGLARAQGTPDLELLRDGFDKLNRADWWVTRGSWGNDFGRQGKADYSGVAVKDGTMTIQADKTDMVAVVYSRPIAVSRESRLVFRRRVKIHAASRTFGGAFEVFGVDDPAMNGARPQISSHLFGVTYQNTNYQTDLNCIALLTGTNIPKGPGNYAGGQAPSIPGIWDTWFDEEVVYDASTGETTYLLNGKEVMRAAGAPLTTKYIKVMMHPYGWGTGHSMVMDSFELYRHPLREQASGPGTGDGGQPPANMGCTGLPPISFPPPGGDSPGKEPPAKDSPGRDAPGDGKAVNDCPVRISLEELPSLDEEKAAVAALLKRFQAAAQARDAKAAADCFRESVREKYQKAFAGRPEKLPDLARALDSAALTTVGPGLLAGDHACRHGSLTFTAGGKSFEASLVRIDQNWFFEQL